MILEHIVKLISCKIFNIWERLLQLGPRWRQVFTEIYLVCPIFAVLAAAVAALAADEAVTLGANACTIFGLATIAGALAY